MCGNIVVSRIGKLVTTQRNNKISQTLRPNRMEIIPLAPHLWHRMILPQTEIHIPNLVVPCKQLQAINVLLLPLTSALWLCNEMESHKAYRRLYLLVGRYFMFLNTCRLLYGLGCYIEPLALHGVGMFFGLNFAEKHKSLSYLHSFVG